MKQDKEYYMDVIKIIIKAAHKLVESKCRENTDSKKMLKRVVDMLNTALEMAYVYDTDEEFRRFVLNQGDSVNGLLDYYEGKYRIFTKEEGEFKLVKFV